MTIDFYGKTVHDYEVENARPYIGYISPKGYLVDYNSERGGKHRTIGNIVSWTFLMWIKESKNFEDLRLGDVKINASFDRKTGIITNADLPSVEETDLELLKLQRDVLEFLRVTEKDPEIIKKIRARIDVDLIPEDVKKYGRLGREDENMFEVGRVFGYANTTNLLTLLKDICIEYLRYDSIEKISPNGEYLVYPVVCDPGDPFAYMDRPRTIDTSNKDIYVRFFNYLLMGYKNTKMPRYVLNSETGLYELEPEGMYSIQSGKDIEYQKELEAVLRLIPKNELYQFLK